MSQPTYSELLESLMSMVIEHCAVRGEEPGVVCDMALSANERAMELLERCGVLTKADKRHKWYKFRE